MGKSQFLTKKQVDKIFGKTNGKSALYERSGTINKTSNQNTTSTASPSSL
ncbi:hypothetical protein [Chryseobacterium fistulae]|uniref:Uncharacterized protein n=1 Tax=Chryseobacterium fistulae TaxID=2675058 RepID=A0A6N4XU46_9FLAO|nr:hypothetical protein [Chryseobacterium fistulae]CAA7387391.1 hypothetical protein CHRY9393_01621 [Chryseobacterium fistulae]